LRVYAYMLESQACQRTNATRQVKKLKGVDGIAANCYNRAHPSAQNNDISPFRLEH